MILDEVLSVGDEKFRKKSEARVKSMMSNQTTVLFVSHYTEAVLDICNKALLLDHGKALAFGDAKDVVAQYDEMTKR